MRPHTAHEQLDEQWDTYTYTDTNTYTYTYTYSHVTDHCSVASNTTMRGIARAASGEGLIR